MHFRQESLLFGLTATAGLFAIAGTGLDQVVTGGTCPDQVVMTIACLREFLSRETVETV